MALNEYQNFFTRVQVHGPADLGIETEEGVFNRGDKTYFSYWMGKIGDAQIGPFYLGTWGVLSLMFGVLAFEIIGMTMWQSVGWDPVQ
ncbi:MAG: photosynthetic reaction center subunit M, partial [Pseudomonadota bacterium]|nr:photosynthetic reaction center subunit M [Pseudomonadota bacterium]